MSDEILAMAHREAWRYRKSSDSHHSDTYTFNRSTLLEFARKLAAMEREACAKIVDVGSDVEAWEIHGGNETIDVLRDLAAKIRMRSNAALTGAEGRSPKASG